MKFTTAAVGALIRRRLASRWRISHNSKPMMARLLRVVLLMLWLELGIILILVPWSQIWDANYFVYRYPALGLVVNSSYIRGAISGLGVMNVLLAMDAFRRRTAAVAGRG